MKYSDFFTVLKETEKAIEIEITIEMCDLGRTKTWKAWVPKSVISDDGEIADWFCGKKADEIANYYGVSSRGLFVVFHSDESVAERADERDEEFRGMSPRERAAVKY